jgi:Protein kinase domain
MNPFVLNSDWELLFNLKDSLERCIVARENSLAYDSYLNMLISDQVYGKSPKSKQPTKRAMASKSTKRSHNKSPSSFNASNKPSSVPKPITPKAVPKLTISNLFPSRSPRKQNPSSTRSRRKSSANNSSNPNNLLGTAPIPRNSSEKLIKVIVTTTQLLQTNKKTVDPNLEALRIWDALKIPTNADTVLQLLENSLSKYEKSEILGYHEIFCIGIKGKKTKSKIDSKLNYGYDDARGDYNIILGDHIAYRYEIIKILGSGSFGQVILAKDQKTNQECAIKVIRNKTRFHQQALVEVEILKILAEKDCNDNYNVVHIIDHLMFRKHMVKSI